MTPIPLLIAITFLLSLSPPTTATTDSVLDTKGHPLKPNTPYYILPVYRGRGGGLTMSPKNTTSPCPLYAAQSSSELSKGKPVKLYPVNYPTQNKVTLSTDMNFVFAAFATGCRQSTGWQLTLDEETGRRYVGLGVVTAPPGPATVSNWFRVEKSGSGIYDYKIVFCPSVCNFCKVACGDVGVFVNDDGKRLLGFNGLGSTPQTLLVRFVKV
ncbi:miraculin-like [Silene latifolia]|uniref:miraculin-like n=1 Tax=Silene latifolia TaxID=37657 RepID=UPI003D776E60